MLRELIKELRGILDGIEHRVTHVQGVPMTVRDQHEQIDSLEPLLLKPVRPRGSTKTANWKSFADQIGLLTKRPAEQLARIYADRNGYLRCILNDDGVEPGWKDWLVEYRPVSDESWEAWCKADTQWLDQLAMAEFIQERISDFQTPAGADMLELAQQFDVVRGGTFSSGVRLDNGSTQLTIEDTVKGRSNIRIPNEVQLGMRVFEDLDAYRFRAFFRWRISDGKLRMSFKIKDRPKILLTAVDDLLARVTKALPNNPIIKVSEAPGFTPGLRV